MGTIFQIEFFEQENGACDVGDWLDELEEKAETDKDARVQLEQVGYAVRRLAQFGTRNPENIMKHLEDGIWELRPGNNRGMLFHYQDGVFVLLHHFRKRTQKTPPREIAQAKRERTAYLRQKKGAKT